ncbi:MAG TPA: 50S ribosomal protein L11 methyltransferase [Pyrinomonadaceae bacterium]|jgi:ribosomal protein L11 methyltransferase|nr:50S ribosomal protein L11 methyltransferase [Pyrinomonadaceae bacterium]
MSPKQWYTTEVTARVDVREAIEYGLMEAGAVGTQTEDAGDDLRITGYFEAPIDQKNINAKLVDALRIYHFTADGFVRVKSGQIADRDWLEEWKKNWRPVAVGRFIVAPPWVSESRQIGIATGSSKPSVSDDPIATAPGSDTIVIRINPGMAFGTGTHETTRLCLKAIEKSFEGGSFLDVGTGTGVLAITAAKLFPAARIEACDTDASAIDIAKENAALNEVADRIQFRVGTVDAQTQSADVICANLTAPVIVELLPELLSATCGHLILSGILESQTDMVTSQLIEQGMSEFAIERDGEWIAITA